MFNLDAKYLFFISLVLSLISIRGFSAEPVNNSKRLMNGTSNPIYIRYIKCIYFEGKKLCSDEKEERVLPGEFKEFVANPGDKHEITKVSSGLYTVNLGTRDDVSKDPANERYIPRCFLNNGILMVIRQYDNKLFCVRGGQ